MARPRWARWGCGIMLWVQFLVVSVAWAGRPCEDSKRDPLNIQKAFELGQKTKQRLDQTQAEVVLLARVGQDLSKYRLRYSHLGLVRHEADGRWLVQHELNQCGSARSALFDEGLANFFLDDMFAYETMIVVPAPAVQKKLARLIRSGLALRLHDPHYNMLAYPFSTQYQNSNQWVLEVLAAAQASDSVISDRAQAQAWLKQEGYRPDTLHLSTLTRLGARMFRANVSFDDHPGDRRLAGNIDTVTVESVLRFMQARDPQTQKVVLSLP